MLKMLSRRLKPTDQAIIQNGYSKEQYRFKLKKKIFIILREFNLIFEYDIHQSQMLIYQIKVYSVDRYLCTKFIILIQLDFQMNSTFKLDHLEQSSCFEEDCHSQKLDYPFNFRFKTNSQAINSFQSSPKKIWNTMETLKYLAFVEAYMKQLEEVHDWEIFKKMSRFIESRTPNQCRILHLKMLKNFQSNLFILRAHENIFSNMTQEYETFKEELIQKKLINSQSYLQIGTQQSLPQKNSYENSLLVFQEFSLNNSKGTNLNFETQNLGFEAKEDKQSMKRTADQYFQEKVNLQRKPKRAQFSLSF